MLAVSLSVFFICVALGIFESTPKIKASKIYLLMLKNNRIHIQFKCIFVT